MKARRIFRGSTLLFLGLGAGLLLAAQSAAASAQSLEEYRMEDSVINVASSTGKAVVSITVEHVSKL